jgi:hypothetical protein
MFFGQMKFVCLRLSSVSMEKGRRTAKPRGTAARDVASLVLLSCVASTVALGVANLEPGDFAL